LLNIDNKISPLPIWRYISKPCGTFSDTVYKHVYNCTLVQFRNFNKKHLILAKFRINNVLFIGNQSAKFQVNLLNQAIVTTTFVRSPRNTSVSGLL